MLKRIGLLLAAALLVATMAVAVAGSVFADPNCHAPQHADHPNCILTGPGESENSQGNAAEHNPNIERDFVPPGHR